MDASIESNTSSIQTPETPKRVSTPASRRAALGTKDRQLVTMLGLCRYLTVQQVLAVGLGGRTEEAMRYRLRELAGEATERKVRAFRPPLLRSLPVRAFDGTRLELWGLTASGYRLASEALDGPLHVPRVDIGAQFAEHFVALTDLFTRLVRPYTVSLPALPFRWDVVGDVELPWRERDDGTGVRTRVLRPDAVLTLPTARRRLFIECETGSNTLVPEAPRRQAVLSKLERYDTYLSGLADVHARLTHYQRRYADGFPCEVLFLVRSERRQRRAADVLTAFFAERPEARFTAGVLTLPEAVAHVAALLPPVQPDMAPAALPRAWGFYGEPEHRAVTDFVLEMHAALAEANRLLRRLQVAAIAKPASAGRMTDFLRRAQAELARRRADRAEAGRATGHDRLYLSSSRPKHGLTVVAQGTPSWRPLR